MADETKKITWTKVWSFIKSKIFIALIIVGLIIVSAVQCSRIRDLKRHEAINNQNQIALHDSLKTERTKNGELNVSIAGFIASEKDLKKLNKELYDKVHAQDGQILSLNHVIVVLKQDTATLRKTLDEKNKIIEGMYQINDSTFVAGWTLPFKYDANNFDQFTGKTYIGVLSKYPLVLKHIDTELEKRVTQIDLIWGQKVEKGQLRVFVQSAYPGFSVQSMEGVLIDPNKNPYIKDLLKKKHWFQGFGVGPGVNFGWDVINAKPTIVVGASLHYNIYTF